MEYNSFVKTIQELWSKSLLQCFSNFCCHCFIIIAEYGARPIRRVLQDKIEDLLSEELLAGNIETGATVTIGAKKGEITIKVKNPVAAEKINS